MVCILEPFVRLRSNPSTVYLGVDREQAASNAANNRNLTADLVRRFIRWPSLEKFDNDTPTFSPSPFSDVPNPRYIWDTPSRPGQMEAFGIATRPFTVRSGRGNSFIIFLTAFADNAMRAKIELYRRNSNGFYVKTVPQPTGLDDFVMVAGSSNPSTGRTEDPPFNWQDVSYYSTLFTIGRSGTYKIVISFDATNYFLPPEATENPAGIQFVSDIYRLISDLVPTPFEAEGESDDEEREEVQE